jgi:preprotein translocase subunit SecY
VTSVLIVLLIFFVAGCIAFAGFWVSAEREAKHWRDRYHREQKYIATLRKQLGMGDEP